MEEKTPGILLTSLPYLSKGFILKVFTLESGLISLFTRKKQAPRPFCLGEWCYPKTGKELLFLKEFSLTDPLIELNNSYEILSAAGAIAKLLLTTQLPKIEPNTLFQLTQSYFQHLAKACLPEALALSFQLKFLRLEGLLSILPTCSECQAPSETLFQGESLCSIHAPKDSPLLTQEEWQAILTLTFTRRFSHLNTLEKKHIPKIALLLSN